MKDKNKVITLPISGSMAMNHSKKYEFLLRDFLSLNEERYYDDEIYKGELCVYIKFENGICAEQRIKIKQDMYICYTTLSCSITPENDKQVIEGVKIANKINCKLDNGNFQIVEETGDIQFRTQYQPVDVVRTEMLEELLFYPRVIINKYGEYFLNMI